MIFGNFKILLSLLFVSILLTNCTEDVEVTYDVYFWSSSINAGQVNSTLFIDGNDEGLLVNPSVEVDCSTSEAILDQLVFLQLSNGIHQIEVRNQNGDLENAGSLELKSNGNSRSTGISSGGTIGGLEVNGNEECLSVKISF